LYRHPKTYSAYYGNKNPAPEVISRDKELIKKVNNLAATPQLILSLEAFLTTCEHVPGVVKKNRVFVAGNRTLIFKGRQRRRS
jgi:hypothetical protein